MIGGFHIEILTLVAVFIAYVLWQVWRTPKLKTPTPFQTEVSARGQQHLEVGIRQAEALERIAKALEKLCDAQPPKP
ncbi:MAG TPA: hypothetical protein VF835_01590 [Rhizomicrobium sp.]